MASGYFPVDGSDAERLRSIADQLHAFIVECLGPVHSGESGGMQYDNTASDGGSLALLALAEQLIRDEIGKGRRP